MARVIFSPTTDPIDPPMKLYSIAETITRIPASDALGIDDGVANADSLAGRALNAFLVGFGRLEFQRIRGVQGVVELVPAFVEQKIEPFVGGDLVVESALRADIDVGFEILLPDGLFAAVALDPKPLGQYPPIFVG